MMAEYSKVILTLDSFARQTATFVLIFFLVLTASHDFAQTDTNTHTPHYNCISKYDTLTKRMVYSKADTSATVTEGFDKLFSEFKKIKIPDNFSDKHPIATKIFIAFVIEPNGQITGKRVIKNIPGTDIAEQALLLIDNVKWTPASCRGQIVPFILILPVQLEFK